MRIPLVAGNWKMHKTLAEARELVQAVRAGIDKLVESLPQKPSPYPLPFKGRGDIGTGYPQPCEGRGDIGTGLPLPGEGRGVNGIGSNAQGPAGVEVLVCPPAQLLFPMAKALAGSSILLGAQNAHEAPQGAFTGEISVPMLKETGCTHIIIGHSERRHVFGERGPVLAKKVRAVVGAGLNAIYCVGETLEDREADRTEKVVGGQIDEVLDKDVPPDRLIMAYEPVWAIGTGRNATPDQARQVHGFIRSRLTAIYGGPAADGIRILYGGSVKPDNARQLADQSDIDGMLVGGASLVAADFLGIIAAVASVPR